MEKKLDELPSLRDLNSKQLEVVEELLVLVSMASGSLSDEDMQFVRNVRVRIKEAQSGKESSQKDSSENTGASTTSPPGTCSGGGSAASSGTSNPAIPIYERNIEVDIA